MLMIVLQGILHDLVK